MKQPPKQHQKIKIIQQQLQKKPKFHVRLLRKAKLKAEGRKKSHNSNKKVRVLKKWQIPKPIN
jgi:hypothetical protein